MNFFLNETERKASGSTCYFEFQNGQYRRKHWLKDSVCLHADQFAELHLYELFVKSVENFNYFGPTEVNRAQWNYLVKNAAANDGWSSIIAELTPWVERCFQKYTCFTICGI